MGIANPVLAQNHGKCIYTGKPATSADHVPPKSFLAPPLPVNLSTVPACADFNSRSALDEQYFITILAHIGHHPALAWRLVEGGDVDRTLTRRPALEERLLEETGVDEDGLPFISPDQTRIDSVLRKLAAGLYFLRFGCAPGLQAFEPISMYDADNVPQDVIDLSWKFQHAEPLKVLQWSVFAYGFCNSKECNEFTYCNINFSDSVFGLIACPFQQI